MFYVLTPLSLLFAGLFWYFFSADLFLTATLVMLGFALVILQFLLMLLEGQEKRIAQWLSRGLSLAIVAITLFAFINQVNATPELTYATCPGTHPCA